MRQLLKRLNQNGSILISLIITLPFLITIVTAYLSLSLNSLNTARQDQFQTHAQFAADAAVDYAVLQINQDETWTGTIEIEPDAEIELNNTADVRSTYEIAVTNDGENKVVTAIGRTYQPSSSTTPRGSVKLTVTLRPVSSGNYSIVTGVGGLVMQNSSKILGGDVLINGTLYMQNSAQIGLSSSPVTVDVAHQSCPNPPDTTYPALCGLGENGEPITIDGSAHIYADVEANNQTSTAGMSNPGLTASSGVTAQALPPHDRAAQQAAVTSTQTGVQASCSSGAKTWPANLKIEGDVTISNSCTVTMEGDVWITGRLTLQNSGTIAISDTIVLGAPNTVNPEIPTIMVDGSAGVMLQNAGNIESNNSDVGAQIITYWSRAACSPDCSDVNGLDLYNSGNDRTIYMQNNADAANSILYARWTLVEISNAGSIGAVVGQTVKLSNSASITFGTSTSGTIITQWVIDGYRRTF